MDLYSASAEDKETVACFFDFHEIGLPPRVTKYPLIDLLEEGHCAQSESQKACNSYIDLDQAVVVQNQGKVLYEKQKE